MRKIIPLLVVVAAISFVLGTAAVKQPNMAEIIMAKQKKANAEAQAVLDLKAKTVAEAKTKTVNREPAVVEMHSDNTDWKTEIANAKVEEEPTKPTAKSPAASKTKAAALMQLHEKFRREWERRRARLYRQMHLKTEQIKALNAAREQFYQETDLAIVDLNSATTNDDAENVIADIDYANDSYDQYVKNIIGEDQFSMLEDALNQMNKEIQKKAPHRFVFVSAW